MNTEIPILYAFFACVVCIGVGAVFGALWGRKHPKIVETVVAEAKKVEASGRKFGS